MARILGLDWGEHRIGVAISTPEETLSVPLRILESKDDQADSAAIAELAKAEGVSRLVIGHPVSLDGTAGPQAKRVEKLAALLESTTGLPVILCDERLSTAQARQARRANGRAGPVDDIAASIILQTYLDRQQHERPEEV